MFSIDLKDAYFQILTHPDSRRYLQIVLNGKAFQFHNSPGLHQGVLPEIGAGSQERDSPALLSG